MTRILHFSDNHGVIPKLQLNSNLVLCTGDFFPDCYNKQKNRVIFQQEWLASHLDELKTNLKGRSFLFVPGNHDFVSADHWEKMMNDTGIEAYNLNERIFSYGNITFYGLPYVPYINGNFNYELYPSEMLAKIDKMVEVLNNVYVDVIAAHTMPYQVLDLCYSQNQRFGNVQMANALNYKINEDMMPTLYCGGHIHSPGVSMVNGMLFSNAATVERIIEI
jgi:Icc-related predicted phosphoesterase